MSQLRWNSRSSLRGAERRTYKNCQAWCQIWESSQGEAGRRRGAVITLGSERYWFRRRLRKPRRPWGMKMTMAVKMRPTGMR